MFYYVYLTHRLISLIRRHQGGKNAEAKSAGEDCGGSHGGDAFAAAGESEAFSGGCLDADSAEVEAEVFGHIPPHLRHMWQHFGGLGHYSDVNIVRGEACAAEDSYNFAEKSARIGAFPLRVCVGKVCAYITEGGSAEQSVAESMKSDIGIAVS